MLSFILLLYTIVKVTCTHGTIQVEDGIVNICAYGELYTLCGDEEAWNKADAEVVCRNLGQNPNGTYIIHRQTYIYYTQTYIYYTQTYVHILHTNIRTFIIHKHTYIYYTQTYVHILYTNILTYIIHKHTYI